MLFRSSKPSVIFSSGEPASFFAPVSTLIPGNEPELWIKTENLVREALEDGGLNFVEIPGEAAFYGPKIDVQVGSAIGREFTLATNQVDFAILGYLLSQLSRRSHNPSFCGSVSICCNN